MNIEIVEIHPNGIQEPLPDMGGKGLAVIMPTTDISQAVSSSIRMIAFAGIGFRMIIAHDYVRQGFIKTANDLAKQINPEFVAYVAQDALAGKNWLKIAFDKLVKENKGLCAFNDGKFAGGIATFGLARMAFCRQFYNVGQVFFEGYHTHRADEELTWLAFLSKQFTYAPDALLLEVDYRLQRAINPRDSELYFKRKQQFSEMVEKKHT